MNFSLIRHLGKYEAVYQVVLGKSISISELKDELLQQDVPKTSANRFVAEITESNPGLFVLEDEVISIDKAKARHLIDELVQLFEIDENCEQLDIKEKELLALSERLKSLEQECDQLRQRCQAFEMENKCLVKEMIDKQLNKEVRFAGAPALSQDPTPTDELLINSAHVFDIEPNVVIDGGTRSSFYQDELDESRELNEKNYHCWIARQIMTVPFFKSWHKEIIEPKEIKTSKISVEKLLANDKLTDQMKLQLYARYSKHRHSELEQLINYAADYGVNANWFIETLETADDKETFESIRDYLRLFAKSSEYVARLQFAKELVAGKWYIKMNYGEKETVFSVVPVEEIKEIRQKLNLPLSKFDYVASTDALGDNSDKGDDMKEKRVQQDQVVQEELAKPSFVKTAPIDDTEDMDVLFGFEAEAISFAEFERLNY